MNNIILIGMMGSGKTTIAKALKGYYNFQIIDTDKAIEREQKMKIAEIFEVRGEKAFRQLEHHMLKNLSPIKNTILSTGGGIILNGQNVARLKEMGTVIYLKGNLATLVARLVSNTKNRPLLSQNKLCNQVEKLLKDRSDLYEKASDLIINIDDKDISEIATEIYKRLS